MTLEPLGKLGEFVATIATLITLGCLAIQICLNVGFVVGYGLLFVVAPEIVATTITGAFPERRPG